MRKTGMRFKAKRNFRYNSGRKEVPEFGRMINGQACGAVSGFRYGICPMSFNGCEVIAVHNALVWLGRPQKLADIAFRMERFRVLMGFFGCNAYKIGRALSYFGAENVRSRDTEGKSAYIVVFWTKRPFLSSIHTVFCVRTDSGTEVYNSSNGCTEMKIYKDIRQYIGKRKPIAVYSVKKNKEKQRR